MFARDPSNSLAGASMQQPKNGTPIVGLKYNHSSILL